MPFLSLPMFDPEAPCGENPTQWLRDHSPRWAFPAGADDDEIRSYVLWLHVHRVSKDLRRRAHAMRPSLLFRIKLAAYRVWVLVRAFDGHLPEHGRGQENDDE